MFRKILLLSLVLTWSCTHQSKERRNISEPNDFSLDWKNKSSAQATGLQHGVWSFFIYSRHVSQKRISHLKSQHALLGSVGDITLHGDLHPLQMREIALKMSFDLAEQSFSGPWWWEVMRVENGAKAIAEYHNFFNYKNGSCLNMYRSILSERVLNPERLSKNVVISDNPLLPRANQKHHVEWSIGTQKENETSQAELTAIQNKLSEEMKKLFNLNISKFGRLISNEPESNTTAYLALDQNNNKWILRKIERTCTDFHQALLLYSPERKMYCLESGSTHYSLYQETEKEFRPQLEFVSSDYQLSRLTRATCAKLAVLHSQQMKPSEVKNLASLLNSNTQFYHFLLRFFDREYQEITKAFRENI